MCFSTFYQCAMVPTPVKNFKKKFVYFVLIYYELCFEVDITTEMKTFPNRLYTGIDDYNTTVLVSRIASHLGLKGGLYYAHKHQNLT